MQLSSELSWNQKQRQAIVHTSSGTGDTGPAGVRHVEPPGGAKVSTAIDMLVNGVASACDLGADCRNGCFNSRAAFGRSFGFLHKAVRGLC